MNLSFFLLAAGALAAPQQPATFTAAPPAAATTTIQAPATVALRAAAPSATSTTPSEVDHASVPGTFSSGFDDARRIDLVTRADGGARLRYRLGFASIRLGELCDLPLGELSFRDRFVLEQLRRTFPDVRADFVDSVEVWTHGGEPMTLAERTVEADGPEPLIQRAAAWLDALALANRCQVLVECSLHEARASDDHADLVIDSLDAARYTELRTVLTESRDTLMVPSVLVSGGSQASVQSLNQVAYIADFEVEITASAAIADPVVRTVQDGISLRVTPIVVPGTGELRLEVEFTRSDLKRPIQQVETSLDVPGASKVTIQLPELSKTSWNSDDLVLSPGSGGIRVRGIRAQVFREDGEVELRDVELLLRAEILDAAIAGLAGVGTVVGHDPTERLCFARFDGAAPPVGDAVEIVAAAGGERRGRGRVVDVQGQLVMIQVSEGEARHGDTVR